MRVCRTIARRVEGVTAIRQTQHSQPVRYQGGYSHCRFRSCGKRLEQFRQLCSFTIHQTYAEE